MVDNSPTSNHILSYCFRDSDGRIIDSRFRKLPLIPASNMKLLTGLSSILVLGKGAHFDLECNVNRNQITLAGGPTPLLDSVGMRGITDFALDHGFNSTRKGKICFASSQIDETVLHPDWQIGDIGSCYLSPITNFSYAENCVPKSSNGEIIDLSDLHQNEDRYISVSDPRAHITKGLGRSLGVHLQEMDTDSTISGEVVHSETLSDILRHTETYSCNFAAEVLLKSVGQKMLGKGTWRDGITALEKTISDFVGYVPHAQFRDGSGLSRLNQLSTEFLSDFISKVANSAHREFIDNLAKPGLGTLRRRFLNVKDESIRAKTGTLEGVSALSGYLSVRKVSFSIILNNYIDSGEPGFQLVDAVLRSFIDENEIGMIGS